MKKEVGVDSVLGEGEDEDEGRMIWNRRVKRRKRELERANTRKSAVVNA